MTYNNYIPEELPQYPATMSKPAAGRSMLSALLASQNQASQTPDACDSDAIVANESKIDTSKINSNSKVYDRTTKVAKTGYSDHGTRAIVVDEHEDAHVEEKRFESPEKATRTGGIQVHIQATERSSTPLTPQKRASPSSSRHREKPTSLLHAALQSQNTNSSPNLPSHQKSPKLTPGECLTVPSEPKSNKGCDNAEGNLIVHKNDCFKIPNRKIQNHSTESSDHNSNDGVLLNNNDPLGMTTFKVLGLLGQGTFAQVFHCMNLETGKVCAVKVVKNKPAYTRQATIEIDVFKTMMNKRAKKDSLGVQDEDSEDDLDTKDFMVSLLCYFMHKSHLCLVFELLGQNLYELLKRRQFRGLPVRIVRDVIKQALDGVNELSKRKIVHCDLKPENILVVSDEVTQLMVDSNKTDASKNGNKAQTEKEDKVLELGKTIKLIDFGSACFEGSTGFTYIQSRFYRSPEVLVGVQYDSAIDMWSLGCVAAELFLGLPILPGVHELDQLGRIQEMIGNIPEWMLDRGKKTMKYYALSQDTKQSDNKGIDWKLKTPEEFVTSLSKDELERYGGAAKLEQPPANRYFKYTHLHDILLHHGNCKTPAEKESQSLFVHFLKGLLNPDPCERWTAYQASSHPFITGTSSRRLTTTRGAKPSIDVNWSPPWDPSICRRKLSFKQGPLSRSSSRRRRSVASVGSPLPIPQDNRPINLTSPNTLRVMNMTGAMSLTNIEMQRHDPDSPPTILNDRTLHPRLHTASSFQPSTSMSALVHDNIPNQVYQQESDLNHSLHQQFDSAAPPNLYSNHLTSIPHPSAGIPAMMGAQSYSGVYHTGALGHAPAPRGDLGYALQRPGVDPCGSLGQMQQMNQVYMQQHGIRGHVPVPVMPSSLGSLIQASSYTDLDASGHYNSMQAMSMPSIQGGHASVPQEYANANAMNYPSSSYQMAYSDINYQHDQSQARQDPQQPFYPYRGSSM